jgi:hypothetical protein
MLIIRKEQIQAFEKAAMDRFEEEMVAHCKQYSTRLCEVIPPPQIHLSVQSAIESCSKYGFTNRGPIRLFIELTLLFGNDFDTDPQYAWSKGILHTQSDQMVLAQRLYERVIDYQEKVSDFNPASMLKALEILSGWTERHTYSSITEFTSAMLGEMERISPRKTAYVGRDGLTDLVLEACTEAENYGVSTVYGRALMGMLMFAFGHGFMEDPLCPWAKKNLEQTIPSDPAARAVSLGKEAFAFLEQITQ